MSIKPTSVPTKTLASSITAAATSFSLNNIIGWDTTALVAGDFGSQHYCVFRNAAKTQLEIMEIDPTTIASASITIVRRGLDFTGDLTTEITANKLSWTKGDTFVDLGTDTPQLWQWLKEYIDAAVVSGGVPSTTAVLGLVKMSTAPVSAANPVALGENDNRVLTSDQAAAAVGAQGVPNSANKFVTNAVLVTAGATINGATLPVPVYQNTTDNEYYACDGNDLTALKFQGFAISNGTNGTTMLLQTFGVVGGFTGLDEGVAYYLSDSVGTIQNTPGTYEVLVGVAISTTQLLIQKGKRRASGTVELSSTGTTAITCGFRPSSVRIHAVQTSAISAWGQSHGGWDVFGGNRCSYMGNASGDPTPAYAGVQTTLAWYVYTDITGTPVGNSGTVTTITDTGFTLNNTLQNVSIARLYWEAEGEI